MKFLKIVNRVKFLLLSFLVLPFCVGCSSYERIDFVSAKMNSLKLVSFSSVNADFDIVVDNPNNFSLNVENISGVLYLKGKEIATFTTPNSVLLTKRGESSHNLLFIATLTDIPSAVGLLSDLSSVSLDDITVDVSADVGKGKVVAIPVKKRGLPIKRFIRSLSE